MSDNSLITLPNTHLREPSKKVGFIDESVLALIRHMCDITLAWEASREHEVGVALAAIQIGIPLRVIVVRNDFDNKQDTGFRTFINPTITKYEGEMVNDYEGCLSVKDVYGTVPRYSKVRVKALDETGKEVRITADGFLARVFQHEIDHTNGKMFLDHIKGTPESFYTLNAEGNLQQLDYEKDIKANKTLWN